LSNLPKQATDTSDDTPTDGAPAEDISTDASQSDGTADQTAPAEAASDTATDAGHEEAAGGEGHSDTLIEAVDAVEGAPPEDHHAEGFFQDTYTYTGLALLILIIIVARPAWRAIAGMLDGRADRIRNELDEAQKLREEAQAALANYQRKQRDALAEAEGILHHAREESERIRQRALEALEHSLKRREQQAMDRIAQAEAAATAEIRSVAVDVAVAAARDIVGQQSDASSDAARINAAIEELPSKLN
jgi:F-type H+-transporting ATPase subunit b